MCPPSSDDSLFARRTIAIAFQRTSERTRRSSAGSPGSSRLVLGVDRVHVRRRADVLDRRAAQAGALDDPLDEIVRAAGAVVA